MPGRHGPSVKQCSGPCHAICPQARGSRDRWTSRRAREVSSSSGCGGMCAKNHQSLLTPPSPDVQKPLGTAGSWPRTELDEHRHLLTTVLLEEGMGLHGCSLQPWSPGCRAARGWKQTHEGDCCFRNDSSRAHSCSPIFSSCPPFLLLFAEGLWGVELSLLIEFTPKDIKLPKMLVLHPVASTHLYVPHSHKIFPFWYLGD